MQICQADNAIVIVEITTDIGEEHIGDDQRRSPQGTAGRRIIQGAADVGVEVDEAASLVPLARCNTGNINILTGNIQIKRVTDGAIEGDGRRIG